MNAREQDRAIALRLERAWPAFFQRYGRLTDVQRAAIPILLEGNNALITAATAAGKTEAACAPLVEANIDRNGPWTILYISPTKALINDMFERLSGPIDSLRLELRRRTGDYRTSMKSVPNVLLTTPESLDSMLCRCKTEPPIHHPLAHVVAVVLDEIHLLHGSARGEQLRLLLSRLRRLRTYGFRMGWTRSESIQIVGLSATITDADDILKTYFGQGEIVRVPGRREIIEAETNHSPFDLAANSINDALPRYVAGLEKKEKILVFSNARRRVDELAAHFAPLLGSLGYKTAAHHGSLSKSWREEAESTMKVAAGMVLFSTSTLEIGIDIGDIDMVVLDGPPPDVSALLQRIGRGSRRSNQTRVLLCGEKPVDVLLLRAMLEAGRDGSLGQPANGIHLHVAVQQMASYIFQSGNGSRAEASLIQLISTEWAELLLRHLLETEEFIPRQQGVGLGEIWRERAATGEIHTNIESVTGQSVIDGVTGETIATGVRYGGGTGLQTGGKHFTVVGMPERNIEVRRAQGSSETGAWSYVSSLPPKKDGHGDALRHYLHLSENTWPIVIDNDYVYVFHLGGNRCSAALRLLHAHNTFGPSKIAFRELYMRVPVDEFESPPSWIARGLEAELLAYARLDLKRYESMFGRPIDNCALPAELRLVELRSWMNLERELNRIRRSVWIEKPEVRSSLLLLL